MTHIEVWHVIDGAVVRDRIKTKGSLAAGTVSGQIFPPDHPDQPGAPCRGLVQTPEVTVLYRDVLKIRIEGGAR